MFIRILRPAAVILAFSVAGAAIGLAIRHVAASDGVQTAWSRTVAWIGTPAPQVAGSAEAPRVNLPDPVTRRQDMAATGAVPAAARQASWPAASQQPHLQARVVVAGVEQAAGSGRIALPSGSRFQLSLTADRGGIVEVHAINPAGETQGTPVWSSTIDAGQRLETPALRLTGERGLETLRVVLRQPGGRVVGERQLQLWHL